MSRDGRAGDGVGRTGSGRRGRGGLVRRDGGLRRGRLAWGRLALAEALRSAARRGDRVCALAVYEPPETWGAWSYGPAAEMPLPGGDETHDAMDATVRALVADVVEELSEELTVMPEVDVEAVPGRPADVLARWARGADELVVGRRGLGVGDTLLLGSVSLSVVLRAPCPVAVVPAPRP